MKTFAFVAVVTIFGIFGAGFGTGFYFLPSLADRVATLERNMEACCGESAPPTSSEESGYADYVALKKRIQSLERQIEEIEAVLGLRR